MKEIYGHFRDGRTVRYTAAIFRLLMTDPDVIGITGADTGEILFDREDGNAGNAD